MKTLAAVLVLSCLVATTHNRWSVTSSALPAGEDQYTTRYDSVDVDSILTNERLYRSYLNCIVADEGKARCTTDAQVLRTKIPDALATGCDKCSAKQKEATSKVIRHIRTKHPHDWSALLRKFDPTGAYTNKYDHHTNV